MRVKTRLSPGEVELVRRRVLLLMQDRRLTAEAVARRVHDLRPDTLRRFLAGRRHSPAIAAALCRHFDLGLIYRPPAITEV